MCGPCYPGGGTAIWNPGIFLGRYPEFNTAYTANPAKFQAYFDEAGAFYLSNCPTSPVQNLTRRLLLLNMLVAHLSYLAGDLQALALPQPVTVSLNVVAPNAGAFTEPHNLGTTPTAINNLPTSLAAIAVLSYDAVNLYLDASEVGATATFNIFGMGTASSLTGEARPVGRVSQASEGSVSANFEMNPMTPGSGPWYAQSQYGAAFWQATTSIRAMRYSPRPTRINRGFFR